MDDIKEFELNTRKNAHSVLPELFHDIECIEKLKKSLAQYMFISFSDDEDPEIGAYIRYIDRRDFPVVLKNGGYVVDYNTETITLRGGKRVWKIYKEFCYIFQKKRRSDYLLEAAANLIHRF